MFAVAAAVIVMIVSVIAVAVMHRKQRRLMDSIEEMLETARKESFAEHGFDESRFSALENRFADYLLTSEISAERVKREKDKIKTLIADISHQTKTPIANIQLYSELLDEMELPHPAKECLLQLHAQTEKLSFLITSLVCSSQHFLDTFFEKLFMIFDIQYHQHKTFDNASETSVKYYRYRWTHRI